MQMGMEYWAGLGGRDVGCWSRGSPGDMGPTERRAGLTIKLTAEEMHHGPGLIWGCRVALGFEKESVSSSQPA